MLLKPNQNAFIICRDKFIQEWSGKGFEIKLTNFFHDRYIIIDNTEVWHLDPSLNRLGVKPAMISKITDNAISEQIIKLFDQE